MNEPRPAMISARPPDQQVEGREVLEDAHGVVGAEDAHRAGQPDVLRARCGGAEDDGRRGDGEVGAVVLADAEDVEPDLSASSISSMRSARRCSGRDRRSEVSSPKV